MPGSWPAVRAQPTGFWSEKLVNHHTVSCPICRFFLGAPPVEHLMHIIYTLSNYYCLCLNNYKLNYYIKDRLSKKHAQHRILFDILLWILSLLKDSKSMFENHVIFSVNNERDFSFLPFLKGMKVVDTLNRFILILRSNLIQNIVKCIYCILIFFCYNSKTKNNRN